MDAAFARYFLKKYGVPAAAYRLGVYYSAASGDSVVVEFGPALFSVVDAKNRVDLGRAAFFYAQMLVTQAETELLRRNISQDGSDEAHVFSSA
jgi:hypothetical protein